MSDTTRPEVTLTSDRTGEDRSAVIYGDTYAFAVRAPEGGGWNLYAKGGSGFDLVESNHAADGDELDGPLRVVAAMAWSNLALAAEYKAKMDAATVHVRKPTATAAERAAYARKMGGQRYGSGRRPIGPQAGSAETVCGDPIGPADLTLHEARTKGRLQYVTCPACREQVSGISV